METKKPKKGLFGRSKVSTESDAPELNEKGEQAPEEAKPADKTVVPVSMKALFRCVWDFRSVWSVGLTTPPRFATKKEITLDIIGLICAAAAGAAQVRIHE